MVFRPRPHLATLSVTYFFFLLITFSVSAQVPQTTRPVATTNSGSSVHGRVVYRDNGRPLKAVTVMVFRSDSNDRLTTITDQRGEFNFDGLKKAKYYVSIQGPGAPAPSGFGVQIPLPIAAIPRAEDYPEIIPRHDAVFTADGTNAVDVEIRIVRGGSIAGRVSKQDGTPVADATINVLSRDKNVGPYMARFSARTDKKGLFKVENVPPAEYLVAASTEDKQATYDIRARLRGESQVVTFHPAAIRLSEALPVRVDSGRESSGVDITLLERATLKISGKLILGRDGSPISGATVVLRSKDSEHLGPLVPGMGQRMTTTASDGSWSFSNVSAGDYEVTALNPIGGPVTGSRPLMRPPTVRTGPRVLGPATSPMSRPRYSIVQEQLGFVSSDIEGMTLTLRGNGRIRGVVETDNGARLPRGLTLFFEFADTSGRPSRPQPVPVLEDGSFELEGVTAGNPSVSVALPSGSDYFILSATAGGEDLTKGMPVVEDAEGSPVRVQISRRYAFVSGRVNPPQNDQSLVVLFLPVDPSRWQFRTAHTALLVAADGSFSGKVPPGEYVVIARRRDMLPVVITRSFVESLGSDRPHVTLSPDERKVFDLPLELP
jgi:hypothetical protein